ncbi:MAG TPA: TonB-dependent receptor [Gemmatimonadaceae bacterium]
MRMSQSTLILTAVLIGSPAYAQETTGRLQGRILADDRVPVAGAMVTISDPSKGLARTARTNDQGYFSALAIPPGTMRVTVRAVGFREVIQDSVLVQLGRTASLGDIVLQSVGVELSPVVVVYDASSIDPVSTTIGSSLDVRFAEKLPIGRDYSSILTLLPQVSESHHHRDGINIAGATGLESAYFVDGVNVTEGYRNSGGIRLPYSFIDHIEIKTGGYEAEFGRATGGIVGVVTRAGSNRTSWSGFSSYTASSLASSSARSGSAFQTGDFSKYDAGFSVGGPLVRDRLWFFAAYDGAIATEDVRLPDGIRTDRTRTDYFAGKLTWRPDAGTDISATMFGDPSRRNTLGNAFWGDLGLKTLVNPDPYLGTWNQGGTAIALTGKRVAGRSFLIDGSLSFARFTDYNAPRTPAGAAEPLLMNFATGEWSGGHGNQWDRATTRGSASFSLSYQRGAHTAKVGLQYEDNRLDEDWRWLSDGPDRGGVIFHPSPSAYIVAILDHQTVAHNRVASAFAQASLLPHPRFRVNAGLRWDGQFFSSPTTRRASSIADQVQPRLGLVFYPARGEDQKITASLGRFYEQVPTQPVSWHWGGLHQQFFIYDHDPRVDPSGGFPFFWDDLPGSDQRGQHFDEITLGYARSLGAAITLGIYGTHRETREVLNGFFVPDSDPPIAVFANPGRGQFSNLAKPISRYTAVELTAGSSPATNPAFSLTYTWSRKYGNYVGVFGQDNGNPNANVASSFDSLSLHNALGLLPNDRTHVFKGLVAQRLNAGITLGATVVGSSGTPLTARASRNGDPGDFYFLERRGSSGRSPFVWDLGVRGTWDSPSTRVSGARLVIDVLHALSQRKALRVDQLRFLTTDESGPVGPNPLYGTGLQFQSPMVLRVGVEWVPFRR